MKGSTDDPTAGGHLVWLEPRFESEPTKHDLVRLETRFESSRLRYNLKTLYQFLKHVILESFEGGHSFLQMTLSEQYKNDRHVQDNRNNKRSSEINTDYD